MKLGIGVNVKHKPVFQVLHSYLPWYVYGFKWFILSHMLNQYKSCDVKHVSWNMHTIVLCYVLLWFQEDQFHIFTHIRPSCSSGTGTVEWSCQ